MSTEVAVDAFCVVSRGVDTVVQQNKQNKLCGRRPQYAPAPVRVDLDLESSVRVTCDVAYLCANFSLPRPLCSRLRPDVRDRQTCQTRIIA